MKRIIAVSDSHGMAGQLRAALCHAFLQGEPDALVFLGDGLGEWQTVSAEFKRDRPRLCLYAVRGNNDWSESAPLLDTFTMDGVKFMLCHGHQYRVKYGLDRLMLAAAEQEAQVALFGHTHWGLVDYQYGCTFVNPGAICAWDKDAPQYADVRVLEGGKVRVNLTLRSEL